MIPPEKMDLALYALHDALVQARLMAFEGAPHEKLARVLDVLELLPMLLREAHDTSSRFREQLQELTAIDPGFGFAVGRFDGAGGGGERA